MPNEPTNFLKHAQKMSERVDKWPEWKRQSFGLLTSEPSEGAVIHFLKLREPYGCLGNFWKAEIQWDWRTWRTSEHLYQALKYQGTDEAYLELVRSQTSAWDAASIGRKGENIRPDWDEVRVQVMLQVLRAKFFQHEDLAKVLLSTGDAELHEHFSQDDFWADGGDGTGQSVLGQLLMQVRSELRVVYGPVSRKDILEQGLGQLIGEK